MLDLAEHLGLDLPHAGDEDAPALREALPPFVGVSNPLDMTAQGLVDPDLYYRTLAAAFADDRFGSVLLGVIQTDPITPRARATSSERDTPTIRHEPGRVALTRGFCPRSWATMGG